MASQNQAATPGKKSRGSLLRDYYGLSPTRPTGSSSPPPAEPAFDPDEEYRRLLSTAIKPESSSSDSEPAYALPGLLKQEAALLSEIRELDGERQSLVYNHHHELIAASETIKKMNEKACSLDTSLASLQNTFQSIAQLSAPLYQPQTGSLPRPRSSITLSVPSTDGVTLQSITLSAQQQRELNTIVTLPERLREIIAAETHTQPDSTTHSNQQSATTKFAAAIDLADLTFERDEPIASKWTEAGNADAGRLLEEARLILRNARDLQRQSMEAA